MREKWVNIREFSTKLARGRFPHLDLAAGCHLSLYGLPASGLAPMTLGSGPKRTKYPHQATWEGYLGLRVEALCVFFMFQLSKIVFDPKNTQAHLVLEEELVISPFSRWLYPLSSQGRSATRRTGPRRRPSGLLLLARRETWSRV